MYVQNDTLLLADVFGNFRNMCLEIYKRDPACFFTASGKGLQRFLSKKFRRIHYDLYVQSDTLLLADVFGNFRNMCLEVYKRNPACFRTAPGLTLQADLKMPK